MSVQDPPETSRNLKKAYVYNQNPKEHQGGTCRNLQEPQGTSRYLKQ
jgi:hypothetical protein